MDRSRQRRTWWRSVGVGLAITVSAAGALLLLAQVTRAPSAMPPGTAAATVACRHLDRASTPAPMAAAQAAAAARSAADASSQWDDLALRTAKYALTRTERDRRETLAACARAGIHVPAGGSATPRTDTPSPVP